MGEVGVAFGLGGNGQPSFYCIHIDIQGRVACVGGFCLIDNGVVLPIDAVGDARVYKEHAAIRNIRGEFRAEVAYKVCGMRAVGFAVDVVGVGFALHPAHGDNLGVIVFGAEIVHRRADEVRKSRIEKPRKTLATRRRW